MRVETEHSTRHIRKGTRPLHRPRSVLVSAAILLCACLAISACGSATNNAAEVMGTARQAELGEALNTAPTAWAWYFGQTASQVGSLLTANNGRLVSLQVESTSPLLFTVAMVQNTGTYQKAWWWFFGQSASQLGALAQSLNARIVSIDPYLVDGTLNFAAILISNTGSDAAGWSWFFGQTPDEIASLLQQNNARLIDISQYTVNGTTLYAVVMISNTGSNAANSHYYLGKTPTEIGQLLQQNSAFLTDIEPADPNGATFNVIMNQNTTGEFWWWYFGLNANQVGDRLSQNGARPLDVKTYFVNGSRLFVTIMLNDSNAETTRVGQILRTGTSAETGLYLKQVGGPVLASLQETFKYDPASSQKILVALHLLKQVDAGNRTLGTTTAYYANGNNISFNTSCPTAAASCNSPPAGGTIVPACNGTVSPCCSTAVTSPTMATLLERMLTLSDNAATRAIVDNFGGFAPFNAEATAVGMTGTDLNSYIGCGPPTNTMTLADAAKLYESIANGTALKTATRSTLYASMPTDDPVSITAGFAGALTAALAIVDAEAPAFGLTAAQIAQFKTELHLHYKAGGFTWNGSSDASITGIAVVPSCAGSSQSTTSYVWGVFVNGDTTNSNTFGNAQSEPLREPIRAALSGWAACSCAPTCNLGQGCGSGSDCISGVCTSGQCGAPTCSGSCTNGTACNNSGDCASRNCVNSTCVMANCGASKCNQGAPCGAPSDCGSDICTNGLCAPPSCSPAAGAAGCPDGTQCNNNGDCGSKNCSNFVCVPPTSCHVPCGSGNPCGASSDCTSHVCKADFTCQ